MPGHILRCHGVFVTHAVNGLVYTESWVIRVVVAIDFDASIVVVVVRMGFHFVAFVVDFAIVVIVVISIIVATSLTLPQQFFPSPEIIFLYLIIKFDIASFSSSSLKGANVCLSIRSLS